MRRQPLEPRLAIDGPPGHPAGRVVRVDLVMADGVSRPLQLDRAEEELGRAFPGRAASSRAKRPGKWTKAILTAARGYRRSPTDPRLPSRSMHRQQTKLAKRANRVALSVERRGIVFTYELHERLLGNRSARRRYASQEPQLDDTQRGIVEALDRDGYVTLTFTELAEERGRRSRRRAPHSSPRPSARSPRAGAAKCGLARSSSSARTVSRESRSAATTRGSVLRLAADARRRERVPRLWSKLSYVDMWYTAQQPATDERVASQNWHVDFDDKHLLKAFVYLSDVGAEHGPFEYIPGSQPGGRHHSVRPWTPMGNGRVPDEDVTRNVPAEEIATFTGPKGTLILCNTSGLHRGGFATAGPRVLATATYCSPASLKALSNRNYSTTLETTDEVVRYAVS